ncbi:MAG TPA: class I SAM-dependent methyltransferase [Gemmatimonadaceae bacterium]
MTLPRFHLFELEDQSWFPNIVRDLATDYLHFMEAKMELHRPVVSVLADALRASGTTAVVDLCAGGGGPVVRLQQALTDAGVHARFILTDKFPNQPAFERLEREHDGIEGYPRPVDATAVPSELQSFRTVFNAFHHFKPPDARAVLQSAVSARQPIGVFEIPERTIPIVIATMVFVPILVLAVTPFIRPFRWERLLFTYLIPLVPLTCFWDGFVSQLRAYRPDELRGLAASLGDVGYEWKAGKVSVSDSRPPNLTYLVGMPVRFD